MLNNGSIRCLGTCQYPVVPLVLRNWSLDHYLFPHRIYAKVTVFACPEEAQPAAVAHASSTLFVSPSKRRAITTWIDSKCSSVVIMFQSEHVGDGDTGSAEEFVHCSCKQVSVHTTCTYYLYILPVYTTCIYYLYILPAYTTCIYIQHIQQVYSFRINM